jgi:hypothetical protein
LFVYPEYGQTDFIEAFNENLRWAAIKSFGPFRIVIYYSLANLVESCM